eukprot:TRINITY_DN6713_c0_g1_i10.p1 TRINITY_DN6713_c0_g1~~TRINITY_DN6713_c0_g1_i10.p1  ORF type:complete len:356 (-),score=34.31 TRINITY_DN6713_c0_g1_i10:142-1209(-)
MCSSLPSLKLIALLCFLPCCESTWEDGKCKRLANLPQSQEEFLEIVAGKEAVVFENALGMFGPIVDMFKDPAKLASHVPDKLRIARFDHTSRPGQGMTTARGDGVETFGGCPIENGTRLWSPSKEWMTFARALEVIEGSPKSVMSWDQVHLSFNQTSSFQSDIVQLPDWFDADTLQIHELNLWGFFNLPTDKVKENALHWDKEENLMYMVTGRKKFTLYNHVDAENLHVRTLLPVIAPPYNDFESPGTVLEHTELDNFSPFDPTHPDFEAYPLARNAKSITCELEAGQALFIPHSTFHYTVSYPDETTRSNLGMNIWFEPVEDDEYFAQRNSIGKAIVDLAKKNRRDFLRAKAEL